MEDNASKHLIEVFYSKRIVLGVAAIQTRITADPVVNLTTSGAFRTSQFVAGIRMQIDLCVLQVSCDWNLSESQESWITGVVFIGMALGAYTWGSISDRYGRKAGFFMTSLFTGVLGIGSAFVRDYPVLHISQWMHGHLQSTAVQTILEHVQ